MNLPKSRSTILAVLVLLAAALPAFAGGARKSDLVRSEGGADEDASGFVLAKSGRAELFGVKVRRVDADSDFVLYIDDGTETLVSAGAFTSNADGKGGLLFNTRRGDVLPVSAASVADLAGRAVEVRKLVGETEETILEGTVPDVEAPRSRGGVSFAALTRPDPAPDEDAEGFVKAKGGKGPEILEILIRKVDGDAVYDVFLADGEGEFTDVGDIEVAAGEGSGKWKVNTRAGNALPIGAAAVADLAGRAVEIRNRPATEEEEAETILEGVVPDPAERMSKGKAMRDAKTSRGPR